MDLSLAQVAEWQTRLFVRVSKSIWKFYKKMIVRSYGFDSRLGHFQTILAWYVG